VSEVIKTPKMTGFIFVVMSTPEEAQAAIAKLHNTTTDIFVSVPPEFHISHPHASFHCNSPH